MFLKLVLKSSGWKFGRLLSAFYLKASTLNFGQIKLFEPTHMQDLNYPISYGVGS